MGEFWHKVMIRGTKSHYNGKGLFDSGSSYSYIDRALAKRLGSPYDIDPASGKITKYAPETIPKINAKTAVLQVKIGNRFVAFNFGIMDNLSEKIILGLDFLQQFDINVDFKKKKLIIPDRYKKR